MKIVTSWDDGDRLDLKVADLLKKYELDGIFFISNRTNQLTNRQIYELSQDFIIGGHTFTHPEDIKMCSDEMLEFEIDSNKEWLEDITGKELKWFCYPGGRHNDKTREQVERSGFKYARTTLVGSIDNSQDRYRQKTSVHIKMNRKEYSDWFPYALELFEKAKQDDNSVFHLWGHSWEVESEGQWFRLEKFLKIIYGHNQSN